MKNEFRYFLEDHDNKQWAIIVYNPKNKLYKCTKCNIYDYDSREFQCDDCNKWNSRRDAVITQPDNYVREISKEEAFLKIL